MREKKSYVAINNITCEPSYVERMEHLFKTRAKAIEKMPGFQHVEILRPADPDQPYLVISHWDSPDAFDGWTKSEAFKEGHARAFKDMDQAKKEGKKCPMMSTFGKYEVIGN
ncbi:MAG: antibiotic biosynthesis monooxygenase [Magnetococcales bacterium]|nr:antibiotic biosynthesis monooxygenase [Magnetococcales bacterium]